MDDDSCSRSCRRLTSLAPLGHLARRSVLALVWVLCAVFAINLLESLDAAGGPDPLRGDHHAAAETVVDASDTAQIEASGWLKIPLNEVFKPGEMIVALVLILFSAFFSASEVAFFSLHRLELRNMRDYGGPLELMVTRLMEHPGSLLTSILMGNSIVNVLLSVVFALPVNRFFYDALEMSAISAYVLSVAVTTAFLVFFGEIFPKVLVVRKSRAYAKFASVPIFIIDRGMTPLRNAIIAFVGLVFRITRFSEVRPAPYMTDQEFMSLLSESEESGLLEQEERQMIQGILEANDVQVREILRPRPDVVALPSGTTVGEAMAVIRQHDFSRIPVYEDDLDHIKGILYAKDLLPAVDEHELSQTVDPYLRKPQFVPETMTVANFVKAAQRLRAHLAVVVDEYGGTEGIVTLQDALTTVVGEFGEVEETQHPLWTELAEDRYRVAGNLPLDKLEQLTNHKVQDEEHTTVAGFVMDRLEKIPEEGDSIDNEGVRYTVEKVIGRRVSRLRIEVLEPHPNEVE